MQMQAELPGKNLLGRAQSVVLAPRFEEGQVKLLRLAAEDLPAPYVPANALADGTGADRRNFVPC
jgi:hypothetical protein